MSWLSRKKFDAPSEAWLKAASEESQYTPDLSQLMKSQFQLLFVYDRMMRGFPEYNKIDAHSVSLATAYTEGKFRMLKRDLGSDSYPIVFNHQVRIRDWETLDVIVEDSCRQITRLHYHVPKPLLLKGQLHAVRPYHFLELDKFMQNGVVFQRERVSLITPYRKKIDNQIQDGDFTSETKAWMYVGTPEFWNPLLIQPSVYKKVQAFQSRKDFLDPYYYFSKLEINDQQIAHEEPVPRVQEERTRYVRGQFGQLRRRTLILLRLWLLPITGWIRRRFRR